MDTENLEHQAVAYTATVHDPARREEEPSTVHVENLPHKGGLDIYISGPWTPQASAFSDRHARKLYLSLLVILV